VPLSDDPRDDGTRATQFVASSPAADSDCERNVVRWDERVLLDVPVADLPRETVRERRSILMIITATKTFVFL
jgi:hypothetical protein